MRHGVRQNEDHGLRDVHRDDRVHEALELRQLVSHEHHVRGHIHDGHHNHHIRRVRRVRHNHDSLHDRIRDFRHDVRHGVRHDVRHDVRHGVGSDGRPVLRRLYDVIQHGRCRRHGIHGQLHGLGRVVAHC